MLRSAGILGCRDGRGGRRGDRPARPRGTPRIANRLLRRVRDVAEVRHDGAITADIARAGLAMFEVDEQGLDRLDHAILRAIIDRFSGGPVGLSTLAAAVGEEPDTVEDVVEPYLLQLGFLQRTPRGRVATPRAYAHLGAHRPRPASPVTAAFPQVGWGLARVGGASFVRPGRNSMILAQTSGGGGSPLLLADAWRCPSSCG